MRSTMSWTLLSFGVICLGFGLVSLFLGFLGVHFHARESYGASATVGLPLLLIGAVLYGAGFMSGKRA